MTKKRCQEDPHPHLTTLSAHVTNVCMVVLWACWRCGRSSIKRNKPKISTNENTSVKRCQCLGEFNGASALGRSLYWCQALHITNKDRFQNNERPRILALLNSPSYVHVIRIKVSSYPSEGTRKSLDSLHNVRQNLTAKAMIRLCGCIKLRFSFVDVNLWL